LGGVYIKFSGRKSASAQKYGIIDEWEVADDARYGHTIKLPKDW